MNRIVSFRNLVLVPRTRKFFSTKVEGIINENEPIKFSTSPAAKPGSLVRVINKDVPWYQQYIVCGSAAVFLIYFCILREESDIDEEFSKTLYDRIEGLEKEQLLMSYKFNKEQGKSVEDIEKRLKEIEAEEIAALKHEDIA